MGRLKELLKITDMLVSGLVAEVAPLVENLTGWTLELESMNSRVINRKNGYEEIVVNRLRGAGIEIDENEGKSFVEYIIGYIVENNVLGVYQPAQEELLIIRENMSCGNLDALKLVVAHELVHRGQHVHHPELIRQVDKAIRETFQALSGHAGVRAVRAKIAELQPLMTLMESHAYYVQELLGTSHFYRAMVKSRSGLATLALRIFGGVKLSQYKGDVSAVKEAMAADKIDSLYPPSESAD